MTNNKQAKISALVLTIAIVSLLVLSGPANALNFSIQGLDKGPHDRDEEVVFTASLNLDSGEKAESIKLVEDLGKKKEKVLCEFNADGSVVAGCEGISIKIVNYGYGYGYGQEIRYEITIDLDNSKLSLGNNKLFLKAESSKGSFSSEKLEIVVKPATPKK